MQLMHLQDESAYLHSWQTRAEMHIKWDAVALMIMSEGGELQAVFVDYLLVTGHTGLTLMSEIYDKTFVKKLNLGSANIRDHCTGATFDGQYFQLLRYFQEWWWKKGRELQQPGTMLTVLWNVSFARGTRHIAWRSSPTTSESIVKVWM
jgi:hypothetical protein